MTEAKKSQEGAISRPVPQDNGGTRVKEQQQGEQEVSFSTSEAVDTLKDDERVYNTMLGKVFSGVSNETRRGIVEAAMRDMGNDFGAATESWLMGLADDGKFGHAPQEDWDKVKSAFAYADGYILKKFFN